MHNFTHLWSNRRRGTLVRLGAVVAAGAFLALPAAAYADSPSVPPACASLTAPMVPADSLLPLCPLGMPPSVTPPSVTQDPAVVTFDPTAVGPFGPVDITGTPISYVPFVPVVPFMPSLYVNGTNAVIATSGVTSSYLASPVALALAAEANIIAGSSPHFLVFLTPGLANQFGLASQLTLISTNGFATTVGPICLMADGTTTTLAQTARLSGALLVTLDSGGNIGSVLCIDPPAGMTSPLSSPVITPVVTTGTMTVSGY